MNSPHRGTRPKVLTRLATGFRKYQENAKCPRPRELPMDHSTLLMSGVLEDYLNYEAFRNDDHWPWDKVQRFSVSASPHSTIAHCALFVGGLTNDHALIRIANESYHHAIRFVRFHSSDAELKRLALALYIATIDLGNYEVLSALTFETLYANSDQLTLEILSGEAPKNNAFRQHFHAGMRIMALGGPRVFKTELGMQVLLGSMPQTVSSNAYT